MNETPTVKNAVSIYGQEGLEDFPVLKAFQQYIDAEQSKARKRMVMLCVFFGFLMTVIIVVFIVMLRDASAKNQTLNDKLVEFAMKERDRQPFIVQPTPNNSANDSAIKAMTESLAALQRQMSEQQAKMLEQQTKFEERRAKMAEEQIKNAASAAAAKTLEPAGPSKEQIAIQKKIDEDTAKLVKARALLKAEKEKIEAEKQRLHREEVERQRRRLFPEYYEKKAVTENAAAETKRPEQTNKPISYFAAYDDDELDEIPARATKPNARRKPASAPKTAAPESAATTPSEPVPPVAKPAVGDRYVIPVEINGADSDWDIPTT